MAKKDNIEIRVMMFGGRRCGKTSVLAAMQQCFDNEFGTDNLFISATDPKTMITIENKQNEMESYFQLNRREFQPDSTPTEALSEYKFNISLKSKSNGKIIVNFIDYPGEWLNNGEKTEELSGYMKKSQIIIVAIDTPHLMEEPIDGKEETPGRFNESRNYCKRIANMLKNDFDLNKNERKMLMFVPLKCEKYRNNGTMYMVYKKIKEAYKSTFNYLSGGNETKCETIITPIYTFGCAEFSHFKRDDNGEIETVGTGANILPKEENYILPDIEKSRPEPEFCEQPMVYILLFVFAMAKQLKEDKLSKASPLGKIINWIGENFCAIPSCADYMMEEDNLKKKIKQGENKTEFVQDPYKLS